MRIWGTGDTDSTVYAISDFYISSKEKADAPDPDALELRKPAYANKASEAVEVSAIVPINVAFDREPVEKQGYAACTLTARYFDLGDTDGTVNGEGLGYYAKGGVLMLNDNVFADAQNDSEWSEIYTDVRPAYTRRDILGDGKTTVTGSTYNYEWDVSGLEKGHYYVLQVVCSYDNEPNKKTSVLTFIKVVDPSKQPLHVISEHNISMDDVASDSKGGIAMGGSWLEENSTVEDATKRLVKYWNSNSYSYDQSNNKAIHYSVEDEAAKNSSGWYEIAKDGTAREMNKDETFKKGHNYVNRLIMQIDSGYNAIFGSWTDVRVGGHSVYDKVGFERTLSNDKKTLTVYILHKNVGVDDSGFHVYLAGTKTPVTDQTKLTVGDEIDVYKTDGLSLYIGSDSGLKAVSGDYDGFERYRILQNETQIQILLYRELNFKSEDDCACASLLFEHEISDRTDEVDGISAPAKTFYSVGSSSLDLTGSEITLYDEDRKGSRMNLDKFLDTYKTKLYYSPDDENYVEWSDDNLNQLGTWQLYVKYNDAYYNAFSIRVGYEQGEYFKLDGKLTDNQSGEANYISDRETKNVVLFVTSSFEATDDKNGVITCEHDLRLKEDGVRAENYKELYPADGATVSYLLPYPDIQDPPFSGNAYDYTIVDADRNVPVSFEKREDGLFVTASRNGEFQIKYFLDIGGDDGGIVVPDEYKDDDDKNDGNEQNADKTYHSRRSGRSSEYSNTATRTFGVWQSETDNNKLFYRFRMKNGVYATGWRLIYWQGAEHWFCFGDDGIMLTGWIMYNGKWYYLNADGDMATGWIMYNGKWYYLNADGDMATGWIMYKDKWYYLDVNGDMATGWIMDNGRQYYLSPDGSLASY